MLLAHKIELRPTPEQIIYLDKACGCRRHCFNQLLEHFSQDGMKWSRAAAYQYYIKEIRLKFPWYSEVSSRVTRNAIDDLGNAFKHFFRRVKEGENPGYPKFRKRGQNDSFALRETPKFDVENRTLRIERLKTRIKMRQKLRFTGKAKQVTISKCAGKYFAAILIETDDYDKKDTDRRTSVGIDFGIKNMALLSDGTVFGANQKLKSNLGKLAKLQRRLSRKVKGSNRRARAKHKIARLHYRITSQRQAILHEISDYVTANYNLITIEDLNVSGMLKNRRLSRAIADAGFGTLRRMIEYKAELRGCDVVVAARWFPSSKICSRCGEVNTDLKLSDRIYRCDCGLEINRDLNAALNLNKYGVDTFKPTLKRTQELSKTGASVPASMVTA